MIDRAFRNLVLHLIVAIAAVGASLLGGACFASAEELSAESAKPLAFRRILVPAEEPAAWPRDGKTFLPVDARDFESWVAAANRPESRAHIADAEYEARFAGNRLVEGRARWIVDLHGAEAAFLPLGHPSIVVARPRWTAGNDEARLGWWPRAAEYGLHVPKSGELEFAWHTLPVRSAGSEVQIPLQLPTSTRRRLALDLPAEKQATLEGGILTSDELLSAVGDGRRRWSFALSESGALLLRITDTSAVSAKRPPIAAVHEERKYRITQRGFDVQSEWRFDANGPLPRELNVALPTGVHLVAATMDGQELSWRVVESADGTATRAIVELADAPQSTASIALRAWGPLVVGEPWRLPKLRLPDAFWSSGSIEVALDESLELRDVMPIDCIQSAVENRDGGGQGSEVLTFDAYSPAADVEIDVALRTAHCRLRVGTTLQVGNPGIAGRMVTQVSGERGELHTLSAELQPGWTIDAVETVPADVLGPWYVDSHQDRRTVELQLNRAVRPGESVAIIVAGSLQRPAPYEPLARESLTMLRWQELEVTRELLKLEAVEPYELEPIGELSPLSHSELSDEDRRLVDGLSESPTYDLKSANPGIAVRLAPKRGSYHAEIDHEATLADDRLETSYRIVCRPQQSGIDHVLVHVSEPMSKTVRWFDADSRDAIPARKMPESDPRLAGLPPGGELWLLDLRGLYLRPVTLHATVALPWTDRRRVPLVSLPEAAQQHGRVTLYCDDATVPTIVAREMSPAPLPAESATASSDERRQPRVVYHYEPTHFYARATPPQLWLGRGATPGTDNLLATEVQVESVFAADGTGAHRVAYRLKNDGVGSVDFTMPAEVEIESAFVDGEPIAVSPSQADPRAIAVRLPTARRSVELVLNLRGRTSPLVNGGELASPLPVADLQMLIGQWTIWLPEEFLAVGDGIVAADQRFAWRERLFGPLARPSDRPRFNPLRSQHWNSLIPGGSAQHAVAATATNSEPTVRDGWHATQIAFVALPPLAPTVLRPTTTGAWSLSIFLLIAVGMSLHGLRPLWWIVACALAALLCLLLPPAFAPMATGALLGLLIAPVCRWAWQRAGVERQVAAECADITRSTATLASCAMGVLLIASATDAAEPTPLPPASIERVLIPVDDGRSPVGEKIYVTDEFLAQLLRLSAPQSAGGEWMLRGMRCEATPASRSGTSGDGESLGTWTLTFDLDVLTRDAKVELPLVLREANWPTAASLDGIPTALAWNDDGNGCALAVSEPGNHQLAITFAPKHAALGTRREVVLTLPTVAGGRFRMVSSVPFSGVRVNGNDVAAMGEPSRATWEWPLDNSGQLTVAWDDAVAASPLAASRTIDELQWLRVTSDGVELRVKYVVPVDAAGPETIDVVADDRWELIAPTGRRSDNITGLSDGRHTIEVPVVGRDGGRREAEVRFRLRSPFTLGRLQIPEVKMATSRAARRWLAVSADASLECEASSGTAISAGTDGDFTAAWGSDGTAAPRLVIDLESVDSGWHLAVRPRAAESICVEQLNVAVGRENLRLQYLADIEPQLAHCFRWSVNVPEEFSVESASAESAEGVVPLRWVRVGPSRLNVYYGRRIASPYRLTIVGIVPHAGSGEVAVPRLSAVDLARSTQKVAVYREADVRVTLPGPGDATGDPPSAVPRSGWSARLVGTIHVDSSTAPPTLMIAPMEPAESKPLVADQVASRSSIGDPSGAPLRDDATHHRLPAVRLAETTTYVGAMGGEFTDTRFVVDPQGLDRCTVVISDDQRLVRLTLDGQPALTQRVDPHRYRVQLRSPSLPQVMEIVTRRLGRNVDSGLHFVLNRPELESDSSPIPVELSLWSLCKLASLVQPHATGAARLTPAERAVARLDLLTSISESATSTAIEVPATDGIHWFAHWSARLRSARELALAEQLPDGSDAATGRVQALANPLETALARCDAWLAKMADVFVDVDVATRDAAPDRLALPPGCTWTHFVTDSRQPTIEVELVAQGVTPAQSRTIALISIAALALAAGWVTRRPATLDALREWPLLAGVAVGIAAWLWMWPSWLGLLVAAVSGAFLLRQAYVRRADRATISTFVRPK